MLLHYLYIDSNEVWVSKTTVNVTIWHLHDLLHGSQFKVALTCVHDLRPQIL